MTFITSENIGELPIDQTKLIDWKKIHRWKPIDPITIPNDRELVSVFSISKGILGPTKDICLAMPKNMKWTLYKIDKIGLGFWARTKLFLLTLFKK